MILTIGLDIRFDVNDHFSINSDYPDQKMNIFELSTTVNFA